MLKSEDRTRNSSGGGEQRLAHGCQGSRSEVSGGDWVGMQCTGLDGTGQQNRSGNRGVEKSLWPGKMGSCQGQKGKLMRGEWADSSCGVLSLGSSSWLRQSLSGETAVTAGC